MPPHRPGKSALAGRRGLAGWLLAATVLLGEGVQAQTTLNFGRALEMALTTHPSIMERRSEQSAALSEKEGAEHARYPTPTLEASSKAAPGASTGVLRVDQPLWAGGRITAGIEAADSRYRAATASVDESRRELALRLIVAYAEALRQKVRLDHATNSVAEHEKLLDVIRRRVSQEVSSESDQRLAESRLLQAQSELSVVALSFRNSLAQLSQLCGEPVRDVIWDGFEAGGHRGELESLLEAAAGFSPMLKRLEHGEMAANADIDAKRSSYWPQLSVRYEKNTGGVVADSRTMLVLSAQPGAGLSAVAGVDAAIARRDAIRQARATAERELRERVTLSWNDLQAAETLIKSASRASQVSSEVFDSYTRQYVIGKKSWIDVLNAVRELTQTGYALGDARAQARAASLKLRAETGALLAR